MIKKQLSIILIISMTSILLNSVIFPSFTYSSELKSRLKEFTIGGISIGDSVKKIKAKNYICNRIFTSGDDTQLKKQKRSLEYHSIKSIQKSTLETMSEVERQRVILELQMSQNLNLENKASGLKYLFLIREIMLLDQS